MRVGRDDAPEGVLSEPHAPERRCILTGAHGARAALIRLVSGPDGVLWPDLAARLPGRGAWIAADRALLEQAMADGRLRRALARALRGPPPAIPPDLAARIEQLLARRLLDRLGLEHRGGRLAFGAERLDGLARQGRLFLLLHAADAADDGRRALDQAFRAGCGAMRDSLVLPLGREFLSKALGRANVVHLGVIDGRAADRIAADLARWRGFARWNDADGAARGAGGPASGADGRRDGRLSPDRQERTDAR
jgi:predicted RNA-binding protein YlxR (DUF448 family)